MAEWKKSSCVLCAQNCGLEIMVENNRITRIKGDKDNPRSKGYTCRKGLSLAHYTHNADRLEYPLKKVGDSHVRISWEQAISEIAEKLQAIKDEYGGKSFAYMGGGSLGGQMEVGLGLRLLSLLGSRYYYSPLGQEFSNIFWVDGRITGRQSLVTLPDAHNADTLVAWGWNGWMSHQEPRTRDLLRSIRKDPDKKLIVIDPRLSETAERADIHLAIKPGSDTMLLKAIIRIILDNNWENKAYMENHVQGWEELAPLFLGFEAKKAVETVCQVNYEDVVEIARLIAQTKSSIHEDLGIFMNRNSTINCYLLHILRAITGRFCVEGGHIIPAFLFPMGSNSDERKSRTWRSVHNNTFPVMGVFPPAIFPEEVLNDNPERLRALIVSACNPLRSFPDTQAYEKALAALDLSVCIEVVYSETARLCDYVLPSSSYLETYDTTCFNFSYPEVYFNMRQPVIKALSPETKEGAAIILEIIKAMGLLPEIPESLYEAGEKGITSYLGDFNQYLMDNPDNARFAPLILAETLGKTLGSVNQALIVGLLLNSSPAFKAGAVSLGYPADITMFEKMYEDILANPQGLIISKFTEDNFSMLATEDKKIALYIEELIEPLKAATITQELEGLRLPEGFPLILHSGLHHETVANTILRNPAWNRSRRVNTMFMNEADTIRLGLRDGDMARITTAAATAEIEVEISPHAAEGCVYIRHGGGLIYDGEKIGVNVNKLVLTTDRDEMGTPMHRRIPCRVEAV